MNRFVENVARVLEVEGLELDTEFRSVEGWCSLHGFGLLVMMENDWSAPLTIDRFLTLRTVRDLYREAFIAFAADLLGVGREALSGETAFGDLPQWDSVNHLRLVMEAEKRFGTRYALESIPLIKKINDFLI